MARLSTKQQILNLAKNYVQNYGYNAFSFQHIADALKIRKASIHYYFKSKEEMGIAVIEDYMALFDRWAVAVHKESVHKKLQLYFNIFERFALDKAKVCPSGTLSVDFKTLPLKVQERLLNLHSLQRQWVVDVINEGQASGALNSNYKAQDMSDILISTIQGGLQVARIRKDPSVFKRISMHLLRQLQ